jgi:hypothetical protein
MRVPPLVVYNLVLLVAFWSSAFAAKRARPRPDRKRDRRLVAGSALRSRHINSSTTSGWSFRCVCGCRWRCSRWSVFSGQGRLRDAVWLGLACAAQVYSGIYNGIFLVTCVVFVAVVLAIASEERRQRVLIGLAASLAVTALLASRISWRT